MRKNRRPKQTTEKLIQVLDKTADNETKKERILIKEHNYLKKQLEKITGDADVEQEILSALDETDDEIERVKKEIKELTLK